MPRRTPTSESEQSIPEMVDELTRQEIATWYKDGKLTPHGRQMAKLLDRALPAEKVDVLIHRQSIVHSLVEFVDGAVLAQLGVPDMRIPIQLALTYPHRTENPAEGLDLLSCGPLTFHKPDLEAFPCLRIALEAAKKGGTACVAMNGANEVAVAKFLKNEIRFYDIPRLVETAMAAVPFVENPTLEQILEADRLARAAVQ